MHKGFRWSGRWTLLVVLLLMAVIVWQQQAIKDWIRLYGYEPPASVVSMATDMSMTDKAKHLLYVNRPLIQDRSSFQTSCSNQGEHTIVLGCYHPVDRGIYIFHVTDERLAGVDQVTLAHETLHAAYDRLKPSQRQRIDTLLQDYFATGLHDERIKSIVATYQKSEPDDVVNEMHSIFATEVQTLPPGLEEYYRQYFQDRSKVVAFATRYQAEFTSRQERVAECDRRLQTMKQQIDSGTKQLDSYDSQITALRNRMDRERADDDIAAYNANVPVYNGLIAKYNALVGSTKVMITSYNSLVNERNQLALQVSELAHSIDSSYQALDQQ